ncbi:zona pellucida sperm-binding protein 4-like [Mixophyes fleayi]|uniref:zona pellucida sperm-binding protein 4-like n=1 Tax=Mixophyes fleayi TaxID=3061075 RepID=UPI003F4D9CA4
MIALYCWAVGLLMYLCHCTHLPTAKEGVWNINPANSPGLYCNTHGLQYIVSSKRHRLISVRFSAFDKKGNAHVLSNNSDCGTWIMRSLSGSVTLHASYDGCYVYKQDNKNKMTISIEREYVSGKRMPPQIKELRCPILGALNRSTPELCSAIPHKERIACASSSITRDMCNKQECCFDDDQINPCYYGNKVTIQCSQEEISIAVSKDLTQPPLRLESIHTMKGKEAACSPIMRTSGLVLFQFNLSTCGTTSRDSDGIVHYENVMVADIDDVRNQNTTELSSLLRLHIQCSVDPSVLSTENAGTLIPSSPPSDAGSKPLTLQMRFAKDGLYLKYYTDGEYPVVKMPQDSIPIEVGILQSTELNYMVIFHQCWATPTEDPEHELKWPFLVNGCLFTGDNNEPQHVSPARYKRLNLPSRYQRFIININSVEPSLKMALGGLVYFHCRASECFHHVLDPCMPLCQERNRRSVSEPTTNMTILVSSKGPVYLSPAQESNIPGKGTPILNEALDKEWVRIVIVVSILSAILIVIYVIKRRSKTPNVDS